jgi:hypothetical protein
MMILKIFAEERKLSLSRGLKAQLALEYWKVGDNKVIAFNSTHV